MGGGDPISTLLNWFKAPPPPPSEGTPLAPIANASPPVFGGLTSLPPPTTPTPMSFAPLSNRDDDPQLMQMLSHLYKGKG